MEEAPLQKLQPASAFPLSRRPGPCLSVDRSRGKARVLNRHHSVLRIVNTSTREQVCGSIRLADTFISRMVGLLGRRSLAAGTGLWICPSAGVHTFGMMFAIDIVALDRTLRVVGLHPDLQPNRIAGLKWSGHSILELAAGAIKTAHLTLGDRLAVETV